MKAKCCLLMGRISETELRHLYLEEGKSIASIARIYGDGDGWIAKTWNTYKFGLRVKDWKFAESVMKALQYIGGRPKCWNVDGIYHVECYSKTLYTWLANFDAIITNVSS